MSKELLEVKLEKVQDSKLDLDSELEDKSLECHELKVMNNMLQETLQKVVAVVEAAKEDKEKLTEKMPSKALKRMLIRVTV